MKDDIEGQDFYSLINGKLDNDSFNSQFGIVAPHGQFYDNKLVILSASIINLKNITKEFLDSLKKNTENQLLQKEITDNDRYVLNHKNETLKEIRI